MAKTKPKTKTQPKARLAAIDRTEKAAEAAAEVPVYVLRADEPAHLAALIGLQEYLALDGDDEGAKAVRLKIREFDLYEEVHRNDPEEAAPATPAPGSSKA